MQGISNPFLFHEPFLTLTLHLYTSQTNCITQLITKYIYSNEIGICMQNEWTHVLWAQHHNWYWC